MRHAESLFRAFDELFVNLHSPQRGVERKERKQKGTARIEIAKSERIIGPLPASSAGGAGSGQPKRCPDGARSESGKASMMNIDDETEREEHEHDLAQWLMGGGAIFSTSTGVGHALARWFRRARDRSKSPPGSGGRRNIGSFSRNFAERTPQVSAQHVARKAVGTIAVGFVEPAIASKPIAVVGTS